MKNKNSSSIERRKKQKAQRREHREKLLAELDRRGIPYRKSEDSGPPGMAYIDTGSGHLKLWLSTAEWQCGDDFGKGWDSLFERLGNEYDD